MTGSQNASGCRPDPLRARLARLIGVAFAKPGAIVVLEGSASVGKTQLAKAAVRDTGAQVKWVYGARSGRHIPLGALALPTGIDSAQTPREVAAAWPALWGEGDVVIVVDDAQWLDAASVDVLRRLVAQPAPPGLLLVIRVGESQPEELSGLLRSPASITVTVANPLHRSDGPWTLDDQTESISALVALVQSQIRDEDPAVSRLLDFLAVHEPLDFELLEVLGCVDAVPLARRRQLVQCGSTGPARLAHPMIGDVVRARSGLLRARATRVEIVAAMGQLGRLSRLQRTARAELAVDSESKISACELTAAAEYSLLQGNYVLAERLASGACARDGGFSALMARAWALSRLGRAGDADAILTAIDPDDLPEDTVVEWLMARVVNLFFAAADPAGALEMYRRYRGWITDPRQALPLDTLEAGIALHLGDLEKGMRIALDALKSPFTSLDSDAAAGWAGSAALSLRGKADQLGWVADRGVSAGSITATALRPHSAHFAVEGLINSGYLPEAAARAEGLAAASGHGHLAAAVAGLAVARVLAARGELEESESELRAVLRRLKPDDKEGWRYRALINLAGVGALLGRPQPELVDAAEKLGGNQVVLRPGVELARARVAAGQGEVRQARAIVLSAAAYSASHGLWSFEAWSLHLSTQLGVPGSEARLTELERSIDGPMIAAMSAHARAFDASDAAGLASAAVRFEELGYLVEAAEALALGVSAYEAAGQGLAAGSLRSRLARIRSTCGDLRTTAIDAAMRPPSLTAREREVAGLIAHGASNREIAARLGLSVRTVEGHIMRACEKLAVSGRAGLLRWSKMC